MTSTIASGAKMKLAKTAIMIMAAVVTTLALCAIAVHDGQVMRHRRSATEVFPHARDQEDLVVHGQTKENANHQDGEKAEDHGARAASTPKGPGSGGHPGRLNVTMPRAAKILSRNPRNRLEGHHDGAEQDERAAARRE